jgi:hypothetical protein
LEPITKEEGEKMKISFLRSFLALIVVLLIATGLTVERAKGYDADTTHQHLAHLALQLLQDRYPNAEVSAYIYWIKHGEWDEDYNYDTHLCAHIGDLVTMHHFWDADLPNLFETYEGYDNAYDRAIQYWNEAIYAYSVGAKGQAYEYLGHIAHLLQDMSVPAHAHLDKHLHKDFYEDSGIKPNWSLMLNAFRKEWLSQDLLDIPQGFNVNPYWDLFYLMYTTHQRADYFASTQHGDWGDDGDAYDPFGLIGAVYWRDIGWGLFPIYEIYPFWIAPYYYEDFLDDHENAWWCDRKKMIFDYTQNSNAWSMCPLCLNDQQNPQVHTPSYVNASMIIGAYYLIPYAVQATATLYRSFGKAVGDPGMNTAPLANAGPDKTVSAGPDCTATVLLDGSACSDPEGDPLTYRWTWGGNIATGISPTILLPVGTTTITLVVNDGFEDSDPDTVDITVADDTPPGMSLSASPQALWPPNHKMVPVTIGVSASDNCDPAPSCMISSVASNEPVNGKGDGNTSPDWEVTGDLTADLRAERSGGGNGRVYTMTVECTDASDNSSEETVEVHVPHDQGDRPELNDDDGDGYSENQGDCNDSDKTIYPGAEEICGDGIDQNCNGRDLPCGVDSDDDGTANDQDSCPDSDLSETVVVDGCDSGVSNAVLSNGCTISDEIVKCGADSRSHGQYVSCVSHLTNDLKHDGILTGREKGAIQSCVASDGDIDGVPDPVEQGPQGSDPNYDGNKDGMPDSQQGNVASCHTHDRKHYVTMACSEPISDAAAVEKPAAAGSPSGVEFPYGFFEFAINVLNPGDTTKMIIYLPVDANPTTYYKYGPTPDDPTNHWYEFMYDDQTLTGAEISGNVVTLHFVDGERGDDDLSANGTIVDQGGPGITSTSTSSSSSGGGGCFIATAADGSVLQKKHRR